MLARLAAPVLALGLMGAAPAPVDGGNYGPVTVTRPAGPMRGFVVLFADGADAADAARLAEAGALVVSVNTPAYLARLNVNADRRACHRLDWDAESLSKQLQREANDGAYLMPILAGSGPGGVLAREAVRQAPPNTLAGAVAVDPAGDPVLTAPFCAPDKSAGGVVQGFVETPAAGELTARVIAHLQPPDTLDDLPLVEMPAAGSDRLAIVLSGDGGWRDLDKTIAERLHAEGVSVIGWDSLRYFWRHKTPEQLATDLARVLRSHLKRWGARQVALIGYSFGADVLPFAYNRLSAKLRKKVSLVALLGFEGKADFEIRVGGWLGLPPGPDALPVADEVARLPASVVLCFYGEDEDGTACPALAASGATVVRTAGSHHFGGDYEALARKILARWKARVMD